MTSSNPSRYIRQTIFPGIGAKGQERLLAAKAVVIGCGALGSALANLLARAGVGHLVIVDRDFIELNNLQRQTLFDEDDIARNLPKAVAAAEKLQQINSTIKIEGIVTDASAENIESLVKGADIVLDGTDNFETRYLLNDACVKNGINWVYGGAIASYGMTMTIRPGISACLRCAYPKAPRPGSLATCDTAGVVAPIIQVVSAWQSAEAMKLLTGQGKLNEGLIHFDVWENQFSQFKVNRRADCMTCVQHRYEFLDAEVGTVSTALCGQNAVQVRVRGMQPISLATIAQKLSSLTDVQNNPYMVRFKIDGYEMSVFPDARAIIKGTADENMARTLFAKYVGS